MKTRVGIFVLILVLAGIVIGWQVLFRGESGLLVRRPDIEISIVHASSLSQWLEPAADEFNQAGNKVEGHKVKVRLSSMDGVEAMTKISQGELTPTVWIPESTALLFSTNDELRTKTGRDVFLTSGEYQRRVLVSTFLVWVMWDDRAQVFEQKYPQVDWDTIYSLVTDPSGWAGPGGNPNWGYPKFTIADPNSATSGLLSLVQATYFYNKKVKDLTAADVLDPGYQQWMKDILNTVVDFGTGSSANIVNEIILFGPSRTDAALVEESSYIQNIQHAQNRWGKLDVFYPSVVMWLDYPYAIYVSEQSTALQKDAALLFEKFLMSEEQQRAALKLGFRPGNPDIPITGPDSPFTQFQDSGIRVQLPRGTAAKVPDRSVWIALQQFFNRVARR
jgi:ABC-type molybdate transport system substrate-binding protein